MANHLAAQHTALPDRKNVSARVNHYVHAALANSSRRAYQRDVLHFLGWGGTIPASSEIVADYLAAHAPTLSVATLHRRLAALGRAHTSQGLPSPTHSDLVRTTFRGIRRAHGAAQRQVAPALKDEVVAMIKGLPGTKGCRDRAMILLGFSGALRRSELVALNVADIRFVSEGITICLRRSKTDQESRGRTIAIPFIGGRHCPVAALRRWLERAAITTGRIFRQVDRYGNVLGDGLTSQTVARVIKERAEATGLDPLLYSGHSLRAGLVTSAAKAGVSTWKIRRHTGHQSEAMLSRYIRDGQLFNANPVAAIWA